MTGFLGLKLGREGKQAKGKELICAAQNSECCEGDLSGLTCIPREEISFFNENSLGLAVKEFQSPIVSRDVWLFAQL